MESIPTNPENSYYLVANPSANATLNLATDTDSVCVIEGYGVDDNYKIAKLEIHPNYTDFYLGLNKVGRNLTYKNLRFSLSHNDEIHEFPKENAIYLESDQEWIEVVRITHSADLPVVVTYSVHDGQLEYNALLSYTTPKPNKPFNSWVWNGEYWQPPVPYPSEGNWRWDEETLSWIEVI